MSNVEITLNIPEELAKNAREFGLLTSEHIVALLEAEVERAIMGFATEEVSAVRAERREKDRDEGLRRMGEIATQLRELKPPMTLAEIEEGIRAARDQADSKS